MIRHSLPTRTLLWIVAILVALILVAPTLVVIPISFTDKASLVLPEQFSLRWYENFFRDPTWTRALGHSFLIGVITTIVATAVGTAAAVGLNRWSRRRLAAGGRAVMLAPMLVPSIILAIGVYAIFLQLQLLGTVLGFVSAHTILALPFVVTSVSAALAGYDDRLTIAAYSLGASRWTAFRKVMLPLIAPGVASGALFAFVVSFDEVVLSLFIKNPYLETLPVKMYGAVTRDTDPTIAAAATIILVITTLIISVTLLTTTRRKNRE